MFQARTRTRRNRYAHPITRTVSAPPPPPAGATCVEGLERRLLFAAFTVTTNADTGPGSLRQAILDANAATGVDSIQFAIGTGAQTISPQSPLPALSDTAGTVIDAGSQPGFTAGNPVITLDGSAAGSGTNGLQITGGNSTVRGLIIRNFGGDQVEISGQGNNTIAGNHLLGPTTGGGDGVEIDSPNNRVGGPNGAADRNVISGNRAQAGVRVMAAGEGSVVENNFIGTIVNGSAANANAVGVVIEGAQSVQVLDNVISGNSGDGVRLTGNADGNIIQGNRIGTSPDGVPAASDLGNDGNGISVGASSSDTPSGNRIGGTGGGDGNLIQSNATGGVVVTGTAAAVGNLILGNSIFANGGVGIDLAPPTGTNPNDPDDSDTGPNALQNAPQLTQAIASGGTTTISGLLDSTAATQFRIEFFTVTGSSNAAQGRTFIGFADVVTDASGIATFNTTLATLVTTGTIVTATATNGGSGNTSEFSNGLVAGVTGAEIQVSGNGAGISSGDTSPSAGDATAFGSATLGATVSRTFTITNTGQGPLDLSAGGGVTIVGGGGQFVVTDLPAATLNAGQSTSFTVNFTPTAAGTQSATVSIPNSDPDENPFTFAVSGQGAGAAAAPEIEVSGNGVEINNSDADPGNADQTNFGTGTIGGTPVVRTFTVRNDGQQNLVLTGVSISGSGAGAYAVSTAPADTTLAPGEQTTFAVRFDPQTGGTANATVSIASNDADENPFTFAVTGLGVAAVGQRPVVTLLPAAEQPAPVLNSPVFDFIVRVADDQPMPAATFDNDDFVVTGPGNFSQAAQFVSISSSSVANAVDVRYRVSAPNGALTGNANGTYTVNLQSGEVVDADGNSATAGPLGSFDINLEGRTSLGQFGVVNGRRVRLTFTEPDGTVVTVGLTSGAGTAFSNADGTFDLDATSNGGKLAVTTRGGNGRAEVDDVRVTGSLAAVTARTADLSGVLVGTAGLGTITLGSTTGATISTPAEIRALNVVGNVASTQVFSGAILGSDARFGGTGAAADTFAGGSIGKFNVGGSVTQSLIAAGLDPGGDAVLLNGNGTVVGGLASRIGAIRVRGTVDPDTRFVAGAYPTRARFGNQTILPATDPRFDMTP